MKRSVLFADDHGIFIDTELLMLRVDFVRDLRLTEEDELILLGDATDCYSISDFLKPDKNWTMRTEGDQFQDLAALYRKAARKSSFKWIMGNHEIRHEKDKCNPKLDAYRDVRGMSFNEIFGVDKYDIQLIDSVYEITSNFIATHGEAGGKFPAKAELDKWNISGISGHSHKTDYSKRLGYKGRIEWFSIGHLADKSKIDMSCRYSQKMLWDRSFALIQSENDVIRDVEIIRCDNTGFYSKYLKKQYGKI